MDTLAATPIAVLLGIIGVGSVFLAAWINAVDISLSRMTLAYAEDLEEEGRKGATVLRKTVASRKGAMLALTVPRGIIQSLGIMAITALCLSQFERFDWPWWLMLFVTLLILSILGLSTLALLTALISRNRYVSVALAGAPMAYRLIRDTKVFSTRSRQRNSHSEEPDQDQAWSRLDLAEDLLELADEVSEGAPEALEEEDREILRSVLELGQTRVGEVMVPRGEMITIPASSNASNAISLFVRSGFSRIPVLGKNMDDIVGVVYFKDVVKRLQDYPGSEETKVSDLMRPAVFIPEMKLADDELRAMQANNIHLALVVDEYGGIAGLVTIEDILEEVVGELVDEHDRPTSLPEEVEPGVWMVPASYSLDDLADLVGSRLEDEDVYSVGGLLAKELGKVLLPGAEATVGDVHLQAGDQVGRRRQILSIRVTKIEDNKYTDNQNDSGSHQEKSKDD